MRALDTSVLAYAVNRFAPEHARAAAVVEALASGEALWGLPWPVLHEFMALVTHPHAVARVLGPRDAWAFVAGLLESPSVRPLGPTAGHAAAVREVLEMVPPSGPGLLPGLETAAVLREHGVRELLSADRGMRRYPFLEVRDPVHGEAWTPDEKPARRYRMLSPRRKG